MRGRIVLFIVLAVVVALVGVYVGWSTNTPQAIGQPTTATPPDAPVASHPPTTKPPTTKPPAPSGEMRFAGPPVVTEPASNGKYTLAFSDDHEVFTLTFNDREATTEEEQTRSFAMTLPLADGPKGHTLRVYVQGYAIATQGASARLTLKLNGLVKVRTFPAGWDDSYLQTLEVPAIPGTTYRLEGVLEVKQDPGSDGSAYLNTSTIDSSFS